MPTTPIITIDGPSGSGKGTIARILANELGWQLLDSGALYRLLAYAATREGISLAASGDELAALARSLDVGFVNTGSTSYATVNGDNVEAQIRSEEIGDAASKVATMPSVRAALLQRQRDFARPPGLVADGRDMGTVVFPEATAKIFLTASAEERAKRRLKQLQTGGINANLSELLYAIKQRDARDMQRSAAPLKAATDAYLLDSSSLDIEQVLQKVRTYLAGKLSLPG